MTLIDADRIEAQLFGADQRVDVARVFLGALYRVIKAVWASPIRANSGRSP
jgi:hypothetical protein